MLRYDWAAIERLTDEIGPDFGSRLTTAIEQNDVRTLALFVAIGRGDDATVEDVMAESPCINDIGEQVFQALNHAYHGRKGAPLEEAGENPIEMIAQGIRLLIGRGMRRLRLA